MTPRQTRFVQEYLIDPNATQAAVLAGYSEKTAYSQGQRLLKKVEVAQAIREAQAKASQRTEVNLDFLINQAQEILADARSGVTGRDRYGKPTSTAVPQLAAANKALELLARFTGFWVEQHNVAIRPVDNLSETELETELAKADAELTALGENVVAIKPGITLDEPAEA